MKSVSEETLKDALEYYRENAFGYGGIEDYVQTEFPFRKDEELEEIAKFIRDNI